MDALSKVCGNRNGFHGAGGDGAGKRHGKSVCSGIRSAALLQRTVSSGGLKYRSGLKDTDVSFRCNLVTLSEEEGAYEDRVILDHSADEISSRDGAAPSESPGRRAWKRSIRQGRICILSGNQLPASAGAKPRDRDGAYPSPRCPDPADRAVSSDGSFASKDDGEKL